MSQGRSLEGRGGDQIVEEEGGWAPREIARFEGQDQHTGRSDSPSLRLQSWPRWPTPPNLKQLFKDENNERLPLSDSDNSLNLLQIIQEEHPSERERAGPMQILNKWAGLLDGHQDLLTGQFQQRKGESGMVEQDVPAPQQGDLKDQWQVEVRFVETTLPFAKFDEDQQEFGQLHKGLLPNRCCCCEEDPHSFKQMIPLLSNL